MSTLANEPAFPEQTEILDPRATGWSMRRGMTMRQYYAGLAMQGILANQPLMLKIWEHHKGESGAEAVASEAIGAADALLAELSKPTR